MANLAAGSTVGGSPILTLHDLNSIQEGDIHQATQNEIVNLSSGGSPRTFSIEQIKQIIDAYRPQQYSASALAWDGVTPVNYYGEVPASDFFTGEELSTLLGVTQGTLQNSDTDWFKFGLGDKIIFIPKLTIRHDITWDHLYSKGLVYGTDDNGLAPTGTPTNQLRIVSKDGFNYKVRLIRGSSIDPHNGTTDDGTPGPHNLPITQGSEWNELMYRVSSTNPNGTSENFAMYTGAQLNVTHSAYTWCQEQSSVGSTYRVTRGSSSVGRLYNTPSSFAAIRVWRPVLELIL